MAPLMSQFKTTANAHMRRDMEAEGKWVCGCEACHGIRSLMGLEKVLEVRPLLRKIEQIEEQFQRLPDGPERRRLLEHSLKLQDELADLMAR